MSVFVEQWGFIKRFDNLQLLTHRANISKYHKKNKELPVGVYWNKQVKKYVSKIRVKGSIIFLGYFTDVGLAHKAYLEKLEEIV